MSRLTVALLAGVALIGAGGIASAQMSTTYDPAQLPAFKGKVVQYLPNPRGEVDGLLLDDGTEVHVPPHLSTQLVFAVHPGDSVTIHGLKARAVAMVAAASITNDASNVTLVETAPHGHHGDAHMEVTGKVKAALHNLRGDVDGVLLDNGSVIHLPPHEATRLAAQLAPGQTVLAHGMGVAGALGTAIFARDIGPDAAHLTTLASPHPGWDHEGGEHWKHAHHAPGKDGAPPPPPAAAPAQ